MFGLSLRGINVRCVVEVIKKVFLMKELEIMKDSEIRIRVADQPVVSPVEYDTVKWMISTQT